MTSVSRDSTAFLSLFTWSIFAFACPSTAQPAPPSSLTTLFFDTIVAERGAIVEMVKEGSVVQEE